MRRTNEEFRAEVFRRKELYLRKRKKDIIKTALSLLACLPLFTVAILASVSILIGMMPAGDKMNGEPTSPRPEANIDKVVYAQLSYSESESHIYIDGQKALEVSSIIGEVIRQGKKAEVTDTESFIFKHEYTVTMKDENGLFAYAYISKEYILYRESYYILPEEKYNEISALAGFSVTE